MKGQWIDDDSIEVGLDEAGRGSLWGRLYVGAVIMSPEDESYFDNGVALRQIKDSKKLTPRKRAVLADYIRENSIDTAVAYAEPEEIDSVNILQADMSAMHRALDSLVVPFQRILVDGDTWRPYKDVQAITIIEGDSVSLPIAAASILAKEAHDEWLREEVVKRPELHERYGLSTNMGYGTAVHMAGLKTWGADIAHRRSFQPVRAVVAKQPLFKSQ
jgi:ribonuclease HII